MSFKTGLVVGFATGYVLGSRAGRERYEQIRAWWGRFTGSPAVQRFAVRGKEFAGLAGHKGMEAVHHGVERASASVRGRLHGDGGDGMGNLPA